MKVFLEPTGLHSYAMVRVARALAFHAPESVEIVATAEQADLRIVHVIGLGSFADVDTEQPHVLIQYCLRTTEYGAETEKWIPTWQKARLVWSYYKLGAIPGVNVYYAPLGVDPTFREMHPNGELRDIGCMTSGYVSASCAEAIEEVAIAANLAGMKVVHLGPEDVQGMRDKPPSWSSVNGLSDVQLSGYYRRSLWVSGLRHGEGFELPVLEGLASGARPIVFDRADMRSWYERHAVFVPECHGRKLIAHLLDIFKHDPVPVSRRERDLALARFDWSVIAKHFWEKLS